MVNYPVTGSKASIAQDKCQTAKCGELFLPGLCIFCAFAKNQARKQDCSGMTGSIYSDPINLTPLIFLTFLAIGVRHYRRRCTWM